MVTSTGDAGDDRPTGFDPHHRFFDRVVPLDDRVAAMTDIEERLRYWRNWWGLKCWLHCCGGTIEHDGRVHWMCADCGKVVR